MNNTKIEWAHHTVNFWWGCTFAVLIDGTIREECRHCYALLLSKLFGRGRATWGARGKRWLRHGKAADELVKLDQAARKRGVRERVFVNSMSDTFEDRADLNEAREWLFRTAATVTNLDVLLLTKRPANVTRMVPKSWLVNWPAHVWIGATAGTQAAADEMIPELVLVPAHVRFLSCEPLFEAVDLGLAGICPKQWGQGFRPVGECIHWVICGGESGAGARPMNPAWARSLRDQCVAANVAFFFKQWGEYVDNANLPPDAEYSENVKFIPMPGLADGDAMWRVGKKTAGRLLDGREWNETVTLEF